MAIGLTLIVVSSLMAIGAASAQATGNWWVAGVALGMNEERELISEDDGMFEFLVTSLNLEILCELEVKGKIFTGGSSLAELLFSQCETFFTSPKLTRSSACDPEGGGNITLLAKGLLFLHTENKKTYERFTPDKGVNFGTVSFPLECALAGKYGITGSFVIEDCGGGGLEANLVRHLVQQAPAALFPGDVLYFGTVPTNAMRLDGSTRLMLPGTPFWLGLA